MSRTTINHGDGRVTTVDHQGCLSALGNGCFMWFAIVVIVIWPLAFGMPGAVFAYFGETVLFALAFVGKRMA